MRDAGAGAAKSGSGVGPFGRARERAGRGEQAKGLGRVRGVLMWGGLGFK